MDDNLIVYGRPGCPSIYPVRKFLKESDITYTYVDIYKDEKAREKVRAINAGNESVPTLVFPDGSTLTEPSQFELQKMLLEKGYGVQPLSAMARLQVLSQHPVVLLIGFGLLVAGFFLELNVLTMIGMVLLAFTFLIRILQSNE